MEIVGGDNQTGSPGNAVPIAPSVRVTDAFGNPVPAVSVTFGGATGGGSVTSGVQVTDASGIATVGSWILGGLAPAQTLTATAGLLSATFHATSGTVITPTVSLFVSSGDGQVVNTFQALQPLVVQMLDPSEAAVPGLTIQFSVISGTATPAVFTTVTDTVGNAYFFPTSGTAGPNIVSACIMPACVNFVHFTFTTITAGSIWTGNVSSDWFTPGNWSTGIVPGAASNVFVPANVTNLLALTAPTFMNEFFLASGAAINIGSFEMQISSNVTTTGGFIFGTGTFRLTAIAGAITGPMPPLIVDGFVTAAGVTNVSGSVTIEGGGRLDIGVGTMTMNGGFIVDPGGRLTMNTAAGTLTILGSAFFSGSDMGDAELTAGLLDVRQNFTATVFNQAFRATGSHTTRLSGTAGAQTINFLAPGTAASRFQNLEITHSGITGVTMSSEAHVEGTLRQAGHLNVPIARTLTINGLLSLESGSLTNVFGTVNASGGCQHNGGTFVGFTCDPPTGPTPLFRRR
jgi:hypothetical protein